ncbi:MAG: phospholipase A2 [Actinomycetota bacterium]
MRHRFAVLVAVTSILTVVSPVSAGPSHSASNDWGFVRHELWAEPLASFIADTKHPDTWFDWSTDGCSAPLLGGHGATYDFRDPCRRHDFGYRNLRLLERRYGTGRTYWNADVRRLVDRQFLVDMMGSCRHRSIFIRSICSLWAHIYYFAVRAFGGP